MPSSKRSKEETWKEDELAKSLKAARSGSKLKEKESSNHRDRDKSKHQNKDEKRISTHSDRKEKKEESRSRSVKDGQGGLSEKSHRSSSLAKDDREHRKRKEESLRDHKSSSEKKRDGERISDGSRNHERTLERKRDMDGAPDRKESRDLERSKERKEGRSRDKEKDRERRKEHEGGKEHRRGREHAREEHRSSGDKDREHRNSGDKGGDHRSSGDKGRDHRSSGDKERDHIRESKHVRGNEDGGEKERSRESRKRHKDKRDDHFREEDISVKEKHERRREKEEESSKRDRKERERKEREEDRSKDKRGEQKSKDDREKRDNTDSGSSHRRKQEGRDRGDKEDQKSFSTETVSGVDVFPSMTKEIKSDFGGSEELHDAKDEDDHEDCFDYEDEEFEDYDDDFEDDTEEALGNGTKSEGSENERTETDSVEDKPPLITLTPSEKRGMEQIKLAINAENERARSASQSPSRPSTSEGDSSFPRGRDLLDSSPRPSQSSLLKGRINFVAAKAMQMSKSAAMKSKQRGKELLKLLELDRVSIHLFELVPTKEYELYMKNFGVADSTQVSTQACQEGYDVDIQTEEIENLSKWCQHSSEVQASGAGEDVDKKLYQITSSANAAAITTDTVRLNNFLLKASQVCLTLLNERAADLQINAVKYQETTTNFSESFVEFGTSSLLIQGRELKSVSPPSVDVGLFLTTYGPSHFTKENADLAVKGLICVWKPSEPSGPQRFLICESTPLCCCFSTPRASFVFAGMDDGSLVMYDLSESPAFHVKRRMRKEKHVLYSATFSTASVLVAENHQGPIVSLAVLSQRQERNEPRESVSINGKRDRVGVSFQIATLDDIGVVNIWIVIEVERPDAGGSEVDLGLSPGGKWKLSKTGSLAMGIKQRTFRPGREICRALSCHVCLNNPNHFYIGTDKGHVVHLARFGERASPRLYKSALESSNTVTTMDISPWNVGCFLVGYDDGILRLYSFQNELPLMEWPTTTAGAPYLSVKWSRCIASAFFTLDVNNVLSGWNLLLRDDTPIWQEKMGQGQRNITHFTLLGGSYSTEEKETAESPEMILFYDNGSIESHRLSKPLIQSEPQEVERFRAFVENT